MMTGLIDAPLTTLFACAVALVIGGMVKGVTGIGLPLVAMPILVTVVPVPQAIALLSVPSMATSVWQSFHGGYFIASARRLWLLVAGIAVGVAVSVRMLLVIDVRLLYLLLGLFIVAYSTIFHYRVAYAVPPRHEPWLAPVTGLISGLIGGVSMLFGPIYAIYLSGLRLRKDFFVAAVSFANLCAAGFLTIALAGHKVVAGTDFAASLVATLPVAAGLVLGQKLRTRINEELFRRVLALVLLGIGLNLVRKAFA